VIFFLNGNLDLICLVQNPEYAGLGGKIGFIWMAFSILSGIYVFFFLPELKGRSLEELDYMFEARIPTRQFASFDSRELLEEKKRQHHTDIADVKEETEKIEGGAFDTIATV
jgi:hypothetical protein